MQELSLTKRQKYLKEYYQQNKERIAERSKQHYQEIRADPTKREEFKKRCTEASRRYRARHKERVKQSRKESRLNRRVRVMEILGGAICKRCGCTEVTFLEINHKNGGGCKEYRAIGNHLLGIILRGERTTEDLEVLCRVCNALDYLEQKNPVPAKHFTVTWK